MPQILGKEVGPIGYGLMGFTWRENPCSQEQAFEAMREALKNGMNLWNGGEFYGPPEYNSLVLLERYFAKYPEDADKVVICIKGAAGPHGAQPDGSPEGIRRSLDNCIKLLNGRKKLDLFECARRDPRVPLETTFSIIQKEYIDTGKLGGISLSEVRAETIHEAVKVAKVAAVEAELSLFSTDILENGVAAACAQYNLPLVAYSPQGRGLLTGQYKTFDDIPANNIMKRFPRFQPGNFEINIELVKKVEVLAQKKGCTPGQLAINWVRAQTKKSGISTIIPIPGGTTAAKVEQNSKLLELTDDELAAIDDILSKFETAGSRYPDYVPHNT